MQTRDMIVALRRAGYDVDHNSKTITPPARAAAPAPQRKTMLVSESHQDSDLQVEPSYEANPFQGSLHPSRWQGLSNRRVPWPQSMDPRQVVREMSSLLAFRILGEQARAMGRTVQQAFDIGPHDEI